MILPFVGYVTSGKLHLLPGGSLLLVTASCFFSGNFLVLWSDFFFSIAIIDIIIGIGVLGDPEALVSGPLGKAGGESD